jgi:hypothetical protein
MTGLGKYDDECTQVREYQGRPGSDYSASSRNLNRVMSDEDIGLSYD